jgi:hypothetical protein
MAHEKGMDSVKKFKFSDRVYMIFWILTSRLSG